jgi:hypothetical protein
MFPTLTTQPPVKIFAPVISSYVQATHCHHTSFKKATQSPWSHVAFILRLDIIDRIIVLESIEGIGVRAIALRNYIGNFNGTGKGYQGKLLIARHQHMAKDRLVNLSKTAVDLLGFPYDTQEIFRILSRISLNRVGISPHSRDSLSGREFICSEYVFACFQSIGIDIPYDAKGFIAPADFARCAHINPCHFIYTQDDLLTMQRVESSEKVEKIAISSS